ncbi:GNAT family N-acetyltransferase [Gulbenkiania mobilis]|uniref:ElaA protein n=1 Tax=Gulbenkiania mobilis TaxID=397457 RepID=A0ABY2D023_GULMO|nr:ElaA protein [Gulbenkiania mobilis]
MGQPLAWACHPFDGFTPQALYEVLALRDRVFVVEQQSIYGDLDGLDQQALHLSGRSPEGHLLAYARLLPPGIKLDRAVAIGRVVVDASVRGTGLGRLLMQQALEAAESAWPGVEIGLSAQVNARSFYESFGFRRVSEPYDDGGILHEDMLRSAGRA